MGKANRHERRVIDYLDKEVLNNFIESNVCMDCGQVIDLTAQTWYRKRNPDGMPRRCTSCAFDALMEMIEEVE